MISVEGLVSDIYIGSMTPVHTDGPYTFIKFSDGRAFLFKGLSPVPIEANRYQVISYWDDSKDIRGVKLGRPPVEPSEPPIDLK